MAAPGNSCDPGLVWNLNSNLSTRHYLSLAILISHFR